MPTWLSIVLGLLGGLAVIGGAAYFAIRPYPRQDKKPWLPDATGRDTFTTDASPLADIGGHGGGAP